jgi:hypothetical protein
MSTHCKDVSAAPHKEGRPQLFGGGERPVEPRFATVRRILVDDSALGSFIDS